MNQKTMYNLSYGLFVLTAASAGQDSGCIINTAGQVTSEPNRISIAVNKANFTHDLVKQSGKFNLSILSEEASFSVFQHFGFQSGRDVDKFSGYPDCKRSANGLYYVTAGPSRPSTWEATPYSLLPYLIWKCSLPHLQLPTLTIIPLLSPSRKSLPPEKPSGAVRCAATSMKARSFRQILSVRCANTRPPTLRR